MKHTKKAFLRQLCLSLIWRLPPTEVREILEDYDGFFTAGGDEGQTEEEVCTKLGSAKEAAKNILKEDGRNSEPLGLLTFAWVALSVWLGWLHGHNGYFRHSMEFYVLCFLLIPILWLLWRNTLVPAAPKGRGKFLVLCLFPLPFWGVVYGVTNGLIFHIDWLEKVGEVTGRNVGLWLGVLGDCVSLAVAGILFLSLVLTWWESSWYLVPAAHAVGAIVGVAAVLSVLRSMDVSGNGDGLFRDLTAIPLVVYLILSLGGMAFTALLIKKGERHGYTA